ncbi:efflux RND transporter permease subunit [Hoeflea poritis]|uniref:MMPL family transporter n=1 Tax=Hoeflea poritis TaxID=2993659 RepID=A0ABT4VL83_9HYPH|nr:MMPL family transporter [Hoeflea poritis]MDA4845425.1 MMPL family transporter [Hoeflea poritis]
MTEEISGIQRRAISGFGLDYPGLFAVRWPVLSAIFLFVAMAVTVASMNHIRFDDDIERSMSSDSVHANNYRQFEQTMGARTTDFIVLISAESDFLPEDLNQIREMTLDLALMDDVLTVLSPFSARFSRTHDRYPGEPVFPDDITENTLTDRLQAYRSGAANQPSMLGDDNRTILISVSVDPAVDRAGQRRMYADIRDVVDDYVDDRFTHAVTGEDAIAFEIVGGMRSDLITLNAIGCLFALIIAFFVFGNLIIALTAIVPAIFGAMSSIALFPLLGLPVTVMSNTIPVLVLVLGLADSIHLVMHYLKTSAKLPAKERTAISVRDIGPACGLTAVTTAIAFAAVAAVDNVPLREFALIGALGVLVSYVIVIMTFAVMAPVAIRHKSRSGKSEWLRVPSFFGHLVFSRSRLVVTVSAVIAVASIWGFSRTEPWYHFDGYLPADSEIRQANAHINETFGGFFPIWHEMTLAGEEDEQNDWARLTALNDAVASAAPEYAIVSLVTIARWIGEPETMPQREDLSELPDNILTQLLSPDGKTARVVTFAPEPMASRQTLETHDRIERTAREAGAVRTVGFPVILRHEPVVVIGQLGLSLVAACIIAILVVAAAFRWPALFLVLIIPNTLPLFVTASALHLLTGGLLNPTAMMALTIAFGIAIDDCIHFINRYRLERLNGHSVDEAIQFAINRTGRVMIATTLLISGGLLVTLLSPFIMVRLFGIMLILTFVTALLADLLLLPVLMRLKWMRS